MLLLNQNMMREYQRRHLFHYYYLCH